MVSKKSLIAIVATVLVAQSANGMGRVGAGLTTVGRQAAKRGRPAKTVNPVNVVDTSYNIVSTATPATPVAPSFSANLYTKLSGLTQTASQQLSSFSQNALQYGKNAAVTVKEAAERAGERGAVLAKNFRDNAANELGAAKEAARKAAEQVDALSRVNPAATGTAFYASVIGATGLIGYSLAVAQEKEAAKMAALEPVRAPQLESEMSELSITIPGLESEKAADQVIPSGFNFTFFGRPISINREVLVEEASKVKDAVKSGLARVSISKDNLVERANLAASEAKNGLSKLRSISLEDLREEGSKMSSAVKDGLSRVSVSSNNLVERANVVATEAKSGFSKIMSYLKRQ